jgi:hypothetical protein
MKALVHYSGSYVTEKELVIKDIGNCAIEASDSLLNFYYLVITTSMGKTYFASCGPVTPDIKELQSGFSCYLSIEDYNDYKLHKQLKYWLNNKNYKISQAKLISKEEALNQFRDLSLFMKSLPSSTDYNLIDEEDDDEDEEDEGEL